MIYALENWNENLKTAKISYEFLVTKFKEKGISIDEVGCKKLFLLNGIYKKILVINNMHQFLLNIRKYYLEVPVPGLLKDFSLFLNFPDMKLFNKFYGALDRLLLHLIFYHNDIIQRLKMKHQNLQFFGSGFHEDISVFPNEEIKGRFNLLIPKDKEIILEAIKYFKLTKESFNQDEINRIYKLEALKYHPDKGGDQDIFKMIVSYKNALNKIF